MSAGSSMATPDATFGLSPQQACLFATPGGRPLSNQCAVVLQAGPDPASLRAALAAIVDEHEILRTTFPIPPAARAPIGQLVHDRLDPAWGTLAPISADALDPAQLEGLLAREAEAIGGPDAGPPLRATLVGLPEGRHLLILTALAACADVPSLIDVITAVTTTADASPEPLQHADYAAWRAELIAGADAEAARGRAFWSAAVEPSEPPPAFPLTPSASASPGPPFHVPVPLSEAVITQVASAAGELGVAPAVVLEAAWASLLARVLGTEAILLAGLADGRVQPDLEGAIGPYSQAVPVPVRIGSDTRFAEVIDQIKRARTEAVRLQDYGSEAQLGQLLDRACAGFAALPEAVKGAVAMRSAVPHTGLGLQWHGAGAEVWAHGAVTDRAGLTALAGWFALLLGASVADPSELVSRLALLDADGRDRALGRGAGGPAPTPAPLVHHAFEAQAARTPDLPAVVGAGTELTFAELNRQANQLAHQLIATGGGDGAPVGLCMSRSPQLIVGLLAILKTGSPYLPLNVAHPPERIAHQLTESGTRIVVSESGLLERLAPLARGAVVCVDRDAGAIAAQPVEDPPHDGDRDRPVYLMYTSGSTGSPKGVVVSHGNLAAYTAAISERITVREGLHFGVVSDISTDLGNTGVFPPLTTGGCIHLIDPGTAMDGGAFAAYVEERPIDVIKITPAHLRALLFAAPAILPRAWLILGGEALAPELVGQIHAAHPGPIPCRILNHYGPTETTVGCCTFEVTDAVEAPASATIPIGFPLPGARAYILDTHLEPLPPGIAGELCIAGTGVATGYVNRPEETAQRFLPDLVEPSGRLYRTGDRARFLPDGAIEFLGRVDDQVKIRGFRVEPGEIEATLLAHPGVRATAVVARPGADGELSLVAYVVPARDAGEALQSGLLRSFLGGSLPEHMIPSRFIELETLPLTASGKVDRRALPDPGEVEAQRSAAFVAPRDALEQEIAAIWCDLLGLSEVSVVDDFFALGGHSLLATQASMRVRRRYGNIPLAALFNAPTVAALADVVRARL